MNQRSPPKQMLARHFAIFASNARGYDFPRAARQLAVDSITDGIGCLFAGSRESIGRKLEAIIPISASPTAALHAPCPMLGGYTTSADAALYVASVLDVLDFDDVSHPGHAHPTAVMLPALLAVTPHVDASGADLISAYLCGFEFMGKLGRALNPAHFEHGWHPTATLGPLMAAIAVASFLRLDEADTVTAISIAASAAGGVRANFGSMMKPFHAGQAARAGVVAALLAREGFTASPDALEHPFGYFSCLRGNGDLRLSELEHPGEPLEILSAYGHALKPYPACAASHPGIEAAILLHGRLQGREIRRVQVGTAELTFKPLIYDRPATSLQGKFSLPFCVAAGLLHGRVGIDTFSHRVIGDPGIRALMERIDLAVDNEFRDSHEYATAVMVETVCGMRLEERIPLAKGKPGRRFSEQDIRSKFLDCTASVLDANAAAELYGRLRAIDGECSAFDLARSMMKEQ